MTGAIPAELGSLNNLTDLRLHGNELTGAIPSWLGSLNNLTDLRLSSNQLTGTIPSWLGSLGNLKRLALDHNQLTGAIPAELGNLSNLGVLYLDRNQLTGTIPAELGSLTNLKRLELDHNRLTGAIPAELGNLSNLEWLRLAGNQLTGCVPDGLRDVVNNDFVLLGLPFCGTAPPVTSTDRDALVALYNATGGPNWRDQTNWLSDRPIGEWYGVTTNASGRVTHLRLTLRISSSQSIGIDLRGRLPAELGSLSNLEVLDLRGNHLEDGPNKLSGQIPRELGNLTNLTYLRLSANNLSGSIPRELGNLSKLELLSLGRNNLTGSIPRELGSLANLEQLFLSRNQLTGTIPSWLGSLSNLEALHLGDNQLTGAIPSSLGNLSNLEWLRLAGNQLTGCVPAALRDVADNDFAQLGLPFCAAPSATDRDALVALYNATGGPNWTNSANWLSNRPLGEWHGVTTDASGRVTELDLNSNQLDGTIPSSLGNLSNLEHLLLSGNQLTGAIPAELGNLSNLGWLDLYGNQLTGTIPSSLGSLSNLGYLYLSNNQLTGAIPSSLGSLNNLDALYLDGNQLTGGIPDSLGSLTNLTDLRLSNNQLTGTIPASLGSLSNLRVLSLDENQLSGAIPAELGSLSNLRELWLHSNQLSGAIPAELGRLNNLTDLRLSNNQLTGTIPSSLGNLSNLTHLYLAGNRLTGCVPAALMDVAQNDLAWLWLPFCGTLAPVDPPVVVFGNPNWPSVQLQTEIAAYMVEHGYGYATEEVPDAPIFLLQGLRAGDIHLLMEVWLPNRIEQWEAALSAGDILDLGTSLGNDWQSAFVIPAYLQEQYPGLDHVEDLKQQQYKSLFSTAETGGKARLVSCVVGWPCEEVNRQKIEGYGLQGHVHIVNPGSGAALDEYLYDAYENGEPWLGYQWGTNDAALLLDLVRLEEPAYSDECWSTDRACAYEDNTVLIGAHSSLAQLAPDVVDFLEQWDFDVDVDLRYATRWLDANPEASINEAAVDWLANHVDTWSAWVTEDAAAAILATLPELPTPAGHSATRSFSATTVAPEDKITVNIALSEYGERGSVTETLPEGFTLVSDSVEWTGGGVLDFSTATQARIVLAGAGVTNVAYNVIAPSEAGGPFKFTGKFVNSDEESVDIGGPSTVTVAANTGIPASYDSNGNGAIELSELFVAIDDYFAGRISLTVLFEIIDLYFSGGSVG